jgi:hypothetical protein
MYNYDIGIYMSNKCFNINVYSPEQNHQHIQTRNTKVLPIAFLIAPIWLPQDCNQWEYIHPSIYWTLHGENQNVLS